MLAQIPQPELAPVKLPLNWFAAVDSFEASELLGDYLGARFVRLYSIVKRTEQDRYFSAIPIADYDWCFRNA